MNMLFVCRRNNWRSPTAEATSKDMPGIHAKSAGTEPSARIKITAKLIDWADIIFCMEKRHKQRLEDKFPEYLSDKRIIVLEIPDEYQFMDPELIDHIKVSVSPYLETII
jgi:predicted protein tyrosine phosphatase